MSNSTWFDRFDLNRYKTLKDKSLVYWYHMLDHRLQLKRALEGEDNASLANAFDSLLNTPVRDCYIGSPYTTPIFSGLRGFVYSDLCTNTVYSLDPFDIAGAWYGLEEGLKAALVSSLESDEYSLSYEDETKALTPLTVLNKEIVERVMRLF